MFTRFFLNLRNFKSNNSLKYLCTNYKFLLFCYLLIILVFSTFTHSYFFTKALGYSSNYQITSTTCSHIDPNFIIPKQVLWDGGLSNVSDDSDDRAYDVTVDNEGNVIVTGFSFSSNNSFLPIIKYNSNGLLLWNKSIPSIDNIEVGDGITTNSIGDIFVAGVADSYSNDAWLWKFSSSGELQWNSTFDGSMNQDAEDLILDSQENIIIVGDTDEFYASLSQQGFICKFDTSGKQIWNKTFGGSENEETLGVAVDAYDNYYITGTVYQNEQYDVFIYKYSFDGELIWNKVIDWKGSNWGRAIVLSKDEQSVFIAGGAYDNSENKWYSYLCKISTKNGRVRWERTYSVFDFTSANDLVLDLNGDIFVVGDTESYLENSVEFFLSKHSHKDGSLLMNYTYGGEGLDRCFGVTYRQSDNDGEHVYLVGETNSFGLTWTDISLLIIDDSDFDSLTDEWEIINGLNPYSADSDNDDLNDYLEVAVYETDPLNPDTDSDGWLDGKEVAWGTNPLNPNSTPKRRKFILSVSLTLPLISGSIASFTIIRKRKSKLRKE